MKKTAFRLALVVVFILFLQVCSEGLRVDVAKRNSAVANAAPIVLSGNITISELVVDGGNSVVVSGSTIILTGNITVKDQGQLLVIQSRLQLSIRGEKTYNVSIRDSGSMIMQGSVLETLSGTSTMTISENASVTMATSEMNGFKQILSLGTSSFTAEGSTLNVGSVVLDGKSASIIGTSMPKGQLTVNATTTELAGFKGDRVYMNSSSSTLKEIECNTLELHSAGVMHLNNTRAGTAILESREKVIVTDSSFGALTILSTAIATNVVVTVEGTQARAGGPIYAGNNTILRYWYLNVNVTDLAGTGIPAEIFVTDYMDKTAAVEKADVNGLYLRAFPAEIVNGTRTIFIGNYRIRARYLKYVTDEYPVVLDGNKDVWVKFTESVPVETTTKLTPSTLKIRAGDKVKFEGYINNPIADEFVEVYAIGPGDHKIQQAFKTDKNGAFKGEYMLPNEGQWYLYANWLGGTSQGISTKSQAFIIVVEPRPPISLLLLRALPVVVIVLGILIGMAFLVLGKRKKAKM